MKTIAELNERWWYRLLKVIYITLLLLAIAIPSVFVYDEQGGFITIDAEETIVQCNSNDPKSFPISDVGYYYFDKNDFNGTYFKYEPFLSNIFNKTPITVIFNRCSQNETLEGIVDRGGPYLLQRMVEITRSGLTEAEEDVKYESEAKRFALADNDLEKVELLDFSFQLFDVQPAYNYTNTALYMIGIVLLNLVIFEVLRRIFYYIILGSFRPKKD